MAFSLNRLYKVALLSMCYCASTSATSIDSLETALTLTTLDEDKSNLLFQLSLAHLYTDPIESISYAQRGISTCLAIENYDCVSSCLVQKFNAQLYYGAGIDSLLVTIKTLERLVNTKLTKVEMVNVLWLYGLYYENVGQTDAELKSYIDALEIVEEFNLGNAYKAGLLGNIGNTLLKQNKPSEAIPYFNRSYDIYDEPHSRAENLNSKGIAYHALDSHQLADNYLMKAKLKFLDVEDYGGAARVLIEQSSNYLETAAVGNASKALRQASELIKKYNINSLELNLRTAQAEYFQKIGNYQEAIKTSTSIISTSINNDAYLQNLKLLYTSYSSIKDYQNAYKYLTKYHNYTDSVNNSSLLHRVEAIKTEFQVNQKEAENQILRAEKKAIQKAIYSKNITSITLLLGALLILSWALYLYLTNKKTKSYQRVLKHQVKERTKELHQANNQLVQVNYELRSFNHIASHDIKEPIRVIGNHLGLIQRKLPVNTKPILDPLFSTIRSSTTQLYNVVENFTKYRNFTSQIEIDIERINTFKLIENISFIYKSKGNFTITTDISKDEHINSNKSMIYIIFNKLIDNGLKFNNSDNPSVHVSSKIERDNIEVSFTDNGIGIDPDYHDKAFELYQRLGRREDFEGTGVGLAIVKLLVTKLQGKIEVKSQSGCGSTFTVSLPINKEMKPTTNHNTTAQDQISQVLN